MPEAQILAMLAELQGVLDLEEFGPALVRAIRACVPCEWISLNAIGPRPEDLWVLAVPELDADQIALFGTLMHENPLIARYAATHDSRAYRFSDLVTLEELHATELHRRFYGPLGIDFQLAFTLPTRPGHILGVALSRTEHDFSDAERDLLEQARPFLIQCYRNVQFFTELRRAAAVRDPEQVLASLRTAGLTAREAEIVHLVAQGRPSAELAAELAVSVRTVDKHLERAYRKLGVSSRVEAAARVWAPDQGTLSR